jgi:ubiquinone/menaquinone biosynthesis C-methylase UbiE
MKPHPFYVPNRTRWKDAIMRLVGAPILLKRLQVHDILDTLALRPHEVVLDFGCSGGYLTYAMARRSAKAHGIDIVDVDNNIIPEDLQGRVEFRRSRGERTPYEDATFDVVLMSEVVPMIDDPAQFFAEVARILKPTGRIVLVNPLERRGMRRDYEQNRWPVRLMRRLAGGPASYDEYTARLQASFGTALRYLPNEAYYHELLERYGFRIVKTAFTPSAAAIEALERIQFFALCLGWPTYGPAYFVLYPLLKIMDLVKPTPRGTGCIMVAQRASVS